MQLRCKVFAMFLFINTFYHTKSHVLSNDIEEFNEKRENFEENRLTSEGWSVGNCISADFGMKFNIPMIKNGVNINKIIYLPRWAKARKDYSSSDDPCIKDECRQFLQLHWESSAKRQEGAILRGDVVLEFVLIHYNVYGMPWDPKEMYRYGIKRVFASFEIENTENTTESCSNKGEHGLDCKTAKISNATTIRVDSGNINLRSYFGQNDVEVLFETPLGYYCSGQDAGEIELQTMQFDGSNSVTIGNPLEATKLHFIKPRLSAFNNTHFSIDGVNDLASNDKAYQCRLLFSWPLVILNRSFYWMAIALPVTVVVVVIVGVTKGIQKFGCCMNTRKGYEEIS